MEESDELESGQQVSLQIWEKTDLGYKAVIDDKFIGLIFKQDAYRSLSFGEKLTGFIKNIREDKKIDLLISKKANTCLLYTSPSPRDNTLSRMPSSA